MPSALRGWFGADLGVPPIRSTGGVVAVLGFASYPYVYLMARGAFPGLPVVLGGIAIVAILYFIK